MRAPFCAGTVESGSERMGQPPERGRTFSARGSVITPYGEIISDWKVGGETFTIDVQVPVGSTCTLTLPDGETKTCDSGHYQFQCQMQGLLH